MPGRGIRLGWAFLVPGGCGDLAPDACLGIGNAEAVGLGESWASFQKCGLPITGSHDTCVGRFGNGLGINPNSRYIYLSKMADSTCIYLLNTADSRAVDDRYGGGTIFVKKVLGDKGDGGEGGGGGRWRRWWGERGEDWRGGGRGGEEFEERRRGERVGRREMGERVRVSGDGGKVNGRGVGIEQSQLSDLTSLLVNFSCLEYRDRWWWSLDPQGLFSVKSTRCWIDKVVLPSSLAPTRWNKLTPRKVNILVWCVLLDRIPHGFRCWIDKDVLPSSPAPTRWNKFVSRKVNILVWRVLLDRIPTRFNLLNRVWLEFPHLGMQSIADILLGLNHLTKEAY
ncbi:hypothetical protein Tco_0175097 [Tanacetum coccineum]